MKTLSEIAHDGSLPPGKRLAALSELILHPMEAGELLADHIAHKRREIANLSGATWNVIDSDENLYNQFELVWERDFWRTLALEGAEKIKQEIANL